MTLNWIYTHVFRCIVLLCFDFFLTNEVFAINVLLSRSVVLKVIIYSFIAHNTLILLTLILLRKELLPQIINTNKLQKQ